MAEMVTVLKLAEMERKQTSQVMLSNLLGVTEVMFPALERNPREKATSNRSETAMVVMSSATESSALKDPGHHPLQPKECQCQSRLSQLSCRVAHVIWCWRVFQ